MLLSKREDLRSSYPLIIHDGGRVASYGYAITGHHPDQMPVRDR